MERFAGAVERNSHLITGNVHVDVYVGILNAYGRAFAVFLVEIVGYSILHPVGHETGVTKIVAVYSGVNGKGLVDREHLVPFEFAGNLIH